MRVNPSTADINVAQQTASKDSVLAFWRQMLQIRKANSDVLVDGAFELIDAANDKVFAFVKRGSRREALIVCNFSSSRSEIPAYTSVSKKEFVFGNVVGPRVDISGPGVLQPWEGRLYMLA